MAKWHSQVRSDFLIFLHGNCSRNQKVIIIVVVIMNIDYYVLWHNWEILIIHTKAYLYIDLLTFGLKNTYTTARVIKFLFLLPVLLGINFIIIMVFRAPKILTLTNQCFDCIRFILLFCHATFLFKLHSCVYLHITIIVNKGFGSKMLH